MVLPLLRHQVGQQPFVVGIDGVQDDERFAYAGQGGELVFDFAQFNAEAAKLDLVIDAAQELDVAVGQIAHEIASLVNGIGNGNRWSRRLG